MVGLTFGPLWGWSSPRIVGLLALGVVAAAAFLVVERRAAAPMVDLALFARSRQFAMGNLAALLNYTAMFATISLTAILLQVAGDHGPTRAGLIMVAEPALMVLLSPFAGRLSDRIGSRALATGGMLTIAVGLWMLGRLPDDVPTPAVVTGLVIVGIGMAAFSSPNTSAVMGAAPHDRIGVASSLLALMRSLGQSLSLAVLGTIAAAPLGAEGVRLLFGAPGKVDPGTFVDGYRAAMLTGAVVAVLGAAASAVRGARATDHTVRHP